MGTINHNAVIATTWCEKELAEVERWIDQMDPQFQPLFIMGPVCANGYVTIVLVPDGSKEGWNESLDGDILRDWFVAFLESRAYSDESSPWKWVEVSYGELGQKLVRGNNDRDF